MMNKQFKRSWLLIVLCFVSAPITIFAQSSQQHKADSVASLIKKYINQQDNPSLYALLSDVTKKSVAETAFASFFSNNIFPLGQAQEPVFIKLDNGTYHYKLAFYTVALDLAINLGQNDKLDNINFRPLTKPAQVLTSNPLKTTLDGKIDSVARIYMLNPSTSGLSIGIISKGGLTTYGYGEVSKENGQLPDANTIFEIGSVTKTFTATLLAYYVNEGKIKLNTAITKYLPDSVCKNKLLADITVLQLSNHTSGLPRIPSDLMSDPKNFHPDDPYENYTKKNLYSYLKSCTLLSVPGETYSYSNLGVGLLGVILEQVSGKTFEQMVTEIIGKPLGMSNTVQHLDAGQLAKFTWLYDQTGRRTSPWSFDALAACGSLHSTVNDLALYITANMVPTTATQLSKAMHLTQQVTTRKEQTVGLGWHIIPIKGTAFYFHNGGTGGSSSFVAFNVERSIVVIVLSNSQISTDALGIGLAGLLF